MKKKPAKAKKSVKTKKKVVKAAKIVKKVARKIVKKIAKKRLKPLSAEHYASSDRLAFRLIQAGDESLYTGLFTDAATVEHFIKPLSPERAKTSFDRAVQLSSEPEWKQRVSVVVERSSGKAIGIASIKIVDADKRIAEVGILLKPDAQSQRYATEASQALITSAFRRHTIDCIKASVALGHDIGEKLVGTLGYTRGEDIAPCGDIGGRSSWLMSREVWANTYK